MCSLTEHVRSYTVKPKERIRCYKVFRVDRGRPHSLLRHYNERSLSYSRRRTYTAVGIHRGYGFYTFRTKATALKQARDWAFKTIVRPVYIWGRVHQHGNGYRAQYLRLA